MSLLVNSNYSAAFAAKSLSNASDSLRKSLARLSSGKRIIDGSDDAGGLSVASKINSRISRTHATKQNVQNAVSFLQVQEGALKNAAEIVSRMSELRTMAADITKNSSDIENYNYEFRELQNELNNLRTEKFNGVSLFGTLLNADEDFIINTRDDQSGDGVKISRVGLFENFKSKYGTDGKLNSGSQGEYRQLVGEFSVDGGILDANPGFVTRDYKEGEVVYRRGTTDESSGYFMALKDVESGSAIQDSSDIHSNWIRVADKNGSGFSEAYPDAPLYDHNSLKINSSGNVVAYLKGDILKLQAHWSDPNSYVYIKAQMDVPRNVTLNKILEEHMGDGKYFDFVGVDRTGDIDGRPTTSYIMPNAEHATPSSYDGSDVSQLAGILSIYSGNYYTPTYVQVGSDIYEPSQNWQLQRWMSKGFEYGDTVVSLASSGNTDIIYSLTSNVKGDYLGGAYDNNAFVFDGGNWYKANGAVSIGSLPSNSTDVGNNWSLVVGTPLTDTDFATNKTDDYSDVTNNAFWTKTHFGSLINQTIDVDYQRGDNIYYQGKHYIYTSHLSSSDKKFTADTGQDGLTSFDQLLKENAVREHNLYVDTIGGGGASDLVAGVYYQPNQDLEFIDRVPDTGLVRTNSIVRSGESDVSDEIFNSHDDLFYGGLNAGEDGIYGTGDDVYYTTTHAGFAKTGGHIDSDADNNKDLLDTNNDLTDFSIPDFVDFIQIIANFRAKNGGTMSRLDYTTRMLDENLSNLGSAYGRIMDADIAQESSNFAKYNVMVQASASMVAQANQLSSIALTLLGR